MSDSLRRDLILAAKQRFAALPRWRQEELLAGFQKAQEAALFHQEYRR